MAVVAVTFDGTRFNTADSYTNWGNYGGSGAGGAAEAPLAYQNSIACNRKQAGTTLGGIDYDPGAGGIDHTSATRRLAFIKAYVTDAFDLNTSEGVRITIGSSSADTRKYNIAGSTATNDAYLAYPAQGGYILTAIDVTQSFWPITTTGTISTTAIDYYGIQGAWITGTAKAENIAMDSIDVGTGLYLVGGTSTDPDASFVTYVEKDQDISTNRWGCVSGAGSNVAAWCELRAGGAIEFNDTTSIVAFKDGYHSAGLTGVLHELDTAASTFTVGATLIGEGKLYNSGALDTRPDYVVTGTTMTADYNFSANIRNFRNITFNSKVVADGADIECQLLTQGSADIENCTIRTNALTTVACLQDPTFAVSTDLNNCEFVQTGAGHAIEIDTAGTYDLQDITFTGYGGTAGSNLVGNSGAADAAIVNTSNGSVTINVNGSGNQPSVRNVGASSSTTVAQTVTVQVKCVDSDGAAIQNARVLLQTAGDVIINKVLTNASGIASASFAGTTPVAITDSRARKSSGTPYYKSTAIVGTIGTNGFDATITMQDD